MRIAKVKFLGVIVLGVSLLGVAAYRGVAEQPAKEGRPSATEKKERALVPIAAGVEQAADDEEPKVSVKELPPVVVQTSPRAGDTEVNADNVREIRVTFSKAMMDRSWSWSQHSEETFPKVTGRAHYDANRRTCILPVKLEAGKTYVLWLNSDKFGNFKDADGHAAVPYLLVFETKAMN